MKKSLLVIIVICLTNLVTLADSRNIIAGNWMLQEIEDNNGDRINVEYGENILIFDELLNMGCINRLKKTKKLSICDMEDYSVYAQDIQQMKLFCYGKIMFDGKKITKRIVYEIKLLTDDKLILEHEGYKTVYYKIN